MYFIGVKLYFVFSGSNAVMNIPVIGASGAVFWSFTRLWLDLW